MPEYKITAPDGKQYKITAPEGTTQEQAMAYFRQQYRKQQEAPNPPEAKPQVPEPTQGEAPSGYMRGLRDPVDAAAQMLYHAVPEGVQQAGNRLNNWLVEHGVPLQRMPSGGLDQALAEQEQQYQQQRQSAGETGMDWGRLAGNVVNPVNTLAASRLPQAATMAGRIGVGAAGGALFGAMQPVTQGDFATEKAKQAGVGAIGGAAVAPVTGAISRIIRPRSTPQVQKLLKEGVSVTPGQALGGVAKKVEEKATSIPIVGDAIAAAHRRGIESMNTAALNRALSPIGEKLPKGIKAGNAAITYTRQALSRAYDKVLPKLTGVADDQFKGELDTIRSMADSLSDKARSQINRILDRQIIGKMTQAGRASGDTLKAMESELGRVARGMGKSQDWEQRQVGSAIREAQAAVRRMLARQNPNYADELQAINKGYSEFAVMRDAASRQGAKEGVAGVGNLRSAVRKSDMSVGKGRFAEGNAKMQDLADAADAVLATKIPDSGTPGRLLMSGAALGGAYYEPSILTTLGLASLPYLPGIERAATATLAQRPEFANAIANAVRRSGPYLLPAAGPAANQLANGR